MPFVPLAAPTTEDDSQPEQATPRHGFVPLSRGFVPLEQPDEAPSMLRNVALNNPLTAAGEAALNLGSQAVALPVAGLAGLATAAGNALGLTDKTGADTVHAVGDALTYQPRGEFGQAAAGIVAYPFQKLAEAGQYVGGKVLDVTGSPLAATAADTAINALPMAIAPARRGFRALTESRPEVAAKTSVATEVDSPAMVQQKAADAAMQDIGQAASVDDATGSFTKSLDTPLEAPRRHLVDVPMEIQPGRFSGAAYTDDLLSRLANAASPEIRQEITTEQLRRSILAEQAAATHQAETGGLAGLKVDSNTFGNLVVRGEPDALAMTAQVLQETMPGQRVALRRIDADGGVSLVVAKGISDAHPELVRGTVESINARLRPAVQEPIPGVAMPEASVAQPDLVIPRSAEPLHMSVEPFQNPEAGIPASPDTGNLVSPAEMNSWAPGANYVGLVDEVRPPVTKAASVAYLPEPIRRDNIIQRFAEDIGTTVYQGRIKGEKRLGFFRPKVEEVRIKHANDIEVAGHEVAHLIDHRVPELRQAWASDKDLRAELKSVSYDQKNVREGFAEGVRLWLTQPETLAAKAPKVHAWLEGFSDSHEYGKALRTAQADMTAWFGQDALNRARSKIGTDKPMAEYFDRFWDKFRQTTVDDLHGIYAMERGMAGKIHPNGPYESARLSRASSSIAEGAVRFGYPIKNPDGSFRFAGKGLEEVMRPVADSLDDALLYFVGRSANELMAQGRERLFTRGEVNAMLNLKTPERAKAFEEYQTWNKGVLDFAEAQGIINPDSRRLWQRTQYLPFHRVEQPGGIKGKPGDWAGIQALTGGTTNIKDVLGNMIGNVAMLIDKAVKNEARRKIANLSQREGGGRFMVKIEPGERMVKIGGDQVLEALLKKFGIALDSDAPAFFEFLIKGQPPAGNNVVAVLQGGKPIWFEVGDPILLRALEAIDRPPMQWLNKWMGAPKRIGQLSVALTPDFMVANIARDTIMGSVMSRAGFRPIIDSLQGMRLRMTEDPLYKEWIANGGGLSSIYLDEGKLRTKLEKFYRNQQIDVHTVLDSPSKMLNFVETVADAFEASTRLGEYSRAVERGENSRHAAYLARDVSTDFAMKGDSRVLGFMYDTVMFLRPAVVSLDRVFRGFAHDPNKGAIAAKTGLVALASMGLYLLNRDRLEYADMEDWKKDSHWHFFIGDQHFMYPKIWEVGAIASLAERTLGKLMDENPDGLGKDVARIIGNTFHLNLTPQIAAPLAEQMANRNSFTKATIETPGMENVQPFMRAKPGTSETMKALGMATRNLPEELQVNPVRAEALLRGYLNTWALYGLALSDKAFFGERSPEGRKDQLPVVRRFYSQEPATHTKYEEQFYDMLGEAKRLHGTMQALDKMNLKDIADEKEQSPLATEAKPLERAAKNLTVINRDMQQVRRDDSLTPAEKRQRIDELTAERNALLKASVQDAKRAQGNPVHQ